MFSNTKTLIASVLFLFTGGLLLQSCNKVSDSNDREKAIELYAKSMKIINLYTDSMLKATDSTTANGLLIRLDDALSHLNYEFDDETDRRISEGENDTLAAATLRFVSVRDSILYRLGHKNPADSISGDPAMSDSVSVGQPS